MNTNFTQWCFLTAFLACSVSADAERPGIDGLAGEHILTQMAEVYASCQTYLDHGSVETVFIKDDSERIVEKPFITAFDRATGFRFEFKHTRPSGRKWKYIIWSDWEQVKKWWDLHSEIEEPESLRMALGVAFGVSGSSSGWVPRLLLLKGLREWGLQEPFRVENAILNGTDCFRLVAKFGSLPLTVWIEKGTFLLRRIETEKCFEDFRTERTINYYPEINGNVTEENLAFDPPTQH